MKKLILIAAPPASGGVTIDNMGDYLLAGAKGFGIATAIVDKKLIGEGNFTAITQLSEKFVKTIKQF